MISKDLERQLVGYGLTTANILYRLPDHPKILQSYLWQDYDIAPEFPELNKFLTFWRDRIEGALGRGGAPEADRPARMAQGGRVLPAALTDSARRPGCL